jgi:hypothetical protein
MLGAPRDRPIRSSMVVRCCGIGGGISRRSSCVFNCVKCVALRSCSGGQAWHNHEGTSIAHTLVV